MSSGQTLFARDIEFSNEEDSHHNSDFIMRIGTISCTDYIYPIMKIISHTLLIDKCNG